MATNKLPTYFRDYLDEKFENQERIINDVKDNHASEISGVKSDIQFIKKILVGEDGSGGNRGRILAIETFLKNNFRTEVVKIVVLVIIALSPVLISDFRKPIMDGFLALISAL